MTNHAARPRICNDDFSEDSSAHPALLKPAHRALIRLLAEAAVGEFCAELEHGEVVDD